MKIIFRLCLQYEFEFLEGQEKEEKEALYLSVEVQLPISEVKVKQN